MATSHLFWDQLLQFVEEGRVVPIVGRDLLTVGFEGRPTHLYRLLAERLAGYLGVETEDLPAGSELNEVACTYLAGGGQLEDIYPAVKKVMPGADELELPEALLRLAEIAPLRLFVSTTFDPLLQLALDRVRFSGQARTQVVAFSPEGGRDLPCEADKLDRPLVYHLFGRLSSVPLEYAVTQEDTLEFVHALQSDTGRPELLFDALGRANLLVLGSSFGGWLARMFLRLARRQRLVEVRGRTDYVADTRVSGDEGLVLFLRHFSARTQVYGDGDAMHFVEELHRRWIERHPPQASGETAEVAEAEVPAVSDEIDVFLSYASEDRDTAVAIRDALEAQHLNVFFDKDDLKAGDDWAAKLRRSIANSALFVPVISRSTLTPKARYFRDEWNEALEQAAMMPPNRGFLMPVAIDETSEQHEALPDDLRRVHWARLPDGRPTPEFVQTVVRLYRDYQKLLAGAI